jgi:hypothetical protein
MIPFLFVTEIEYQNREELAEPTEDDIQEIQDAAKKAKAKKRDIIDTLVLMSAPSVIELPLETSVRLEHSV